jgi:hypothetical protein
VPVAALLACLVALLAACGGDDSGGSTATATTPTPAGVKCGVERWPVKTLSDDRAGQVDFTPRATTVDSLRNLPDPKPAIKGNEKRQDGTEKQTFTVQATLLSFKREDDEDIHLVIADPSDRTHTMIVEFPDVDCSGAISSAKKAEMEAARAAFVAACGEPTASFRELTGTATVTGVAFFDKKHGQNGLAPNGIELHPVLAFESADCARPGTPTPTPRPTRTPPPTPTPTPGLPTNTPASTPTP